MVKIKIQKYLDALNPDLGFIFNKRKDFEESVAHVNDTISAYIDGEEEKAQRIFPHYFEKYKTDGIDYNLYVGASLVQNQEYNPSNNCCEATASTPSKGSSRNKVPTVTATIGTP